MHKTLTEASLDERVSEEGTPRGLGLDGSATLGVTLSLTPEPGLLSEFWVDTG
jgi:hypothetical protein